MKIMGVRVDPRTKLTLSEQSVMVSELTHTHTRMRTTVV